MAITDGSKRIAATIGAELSHRHNVISKEIPPAITISPGEIVRFEVPGLPLPRRAAKGDEQRIDLEHPHTCVGPVAVQGAEPGSVLVAELLSVEVNQDFGHCIVLPSALCPDVTCELHVQSFEFEDGHAELRPGVRIPLRPFCGIMGAAPREPGRHTTVTPRAVGGNLDMRVLTSGATLYVPVEVENGQFSCGDGHGVQGSGEVCGTALETGVSALVRFDVRNDLSLDHPAVHTPPAVVPERPAGTYVTTATGGDLYRCSQEALTRMLKHLCEERGLDKREAHVLASLCVDLTIEEIVNRGTWVVAASLPLHVFDD